MGCVPSSTKKIPPNPNTYNSHANLQSSNIHRSPPLTIPFLEQEEEVKEVLSETPIINSPIIHNTDENNSIPKNFSPKEKKQCHNNHDSVFKIAKIFNPKDEHCEVSDMYRKFSRSMRVGSDPKETVKELNMSIRVGSDPKETAREQSKVMRVGSSGQKETFKELSRNSRVGSDPKETIKDVTAELRLRSPAKHRNTSPARRTDPLSGSGQTRNLSPARRSDHLSVSTRNISPAKRLEHLTGSGQTRNTSPARMTDHLTGSGQTRNTSPARMTVHKTGSGQTRNTSPSRRTDHQTGWGQTLNTSPARRTDHLTGSGQTRNISPSRVGSGRNIGGISRTANGESSCRRSRSPIMCRDQFNGGTRNSISRCPSSRKSGKSPRRVRSELGDRLRSPMEAGNSSRSNSKRHMRSGINESLENPLVSMECFIFI
ncbi:uncharacterized protein LOC132037319 [Lycium ferocissimum]|uniref:uncharacterized protein LOC132037319 n=1 Tax=Lycium ferocissimum TaxID=112874 RepID=UPI002814ED0E|nr:uncharacterized protein LOC132037319 [Lycium ferocissimum]